MLCAVVAQTPVIADCRKPIASLQPQPTGTVVQAGRPLWPKPIYGAPVCATCLSVALCGNRLVTSPAAVRVDDLRPVQSGHLNTDLSFTYKL